MTKTDCIDLAEELLNDIPTIDAVDLVRCKACKKVDVVRCKHCRKWTNGDDTYGTCQWNEYRTLQTRFDDFCSYGKRDEDYCSYGERK